MPDTRSPTKTELLEMLRESGARIVEHVRAMPVARLDEGRYENGWSAREILAHIAAIEWTYPRLLDVAAEAPATPDGAPRADLRGTSPEQAAGAPTRPVSGGIDAYNARQVEKRAGASVAELLAEFEKNRAATVGAVEAADDALLERPVRSAGGITGTLAGVLRAVAVEHVLGHARDIAGE